ncbi:hypothetical protein AMELA_G00029090 [Ameiurus melas]|uniref:Uncharacterized protein n=1 Tax=Ameiurus melas TaxID=219545 RepID=A0A7J6BD83_AMEME|nr:hypothetical protein AMELA_G00029090 [Ameiurus melas]
MTLQFDVVKTRRQIELGETELLGGFLPRVIKVAPACAIMISTYEFGKAFFRKRNEEQRRGGDVWRSITAELLDRFHPN